MQIKNITIGSCLSSVLFAYYNNHTLILNSKQKPFRFDSLERDVQFIDLSTDNHLTLWSWVVYEMSFQGSVPFGPCVSSVRIEENKMHIVPRQGLKIEVDFDKCYIFDDSNITFDNPVTKVNDPLYRVFDWMDIRAGARHTVTKITTGDDLVRYAYFYKSERMDGNHSNKDVVTVSYLTDEQINSFDYSDTMAKFKIHSLMKSNGIGDKRRSSVKVESTRREVIKISKNVFRDSKSVKFMKMSPMKVIEQYA